MGYIHQFFLKSYLNSSDKKISLKNGEGNNYRVREITESIIRVREISESRIKTDEKEREIGESNLRGRKIQTSRHLIHIFKAKSHLFLIHLYKSLNKLISIFGE